jgi:predicted secreted Zn-dependent protease
VKIVDRRIDEENKTCTATAIMPKKEITPKLPAGAQELSTTVIR